MQLIPHIVLFITDKVSSAVNDHGAEDEYVEVDLPPLPENTADFDSKLQLSCCYSVTTASSFLL